MIQHAYKIMIYDHQGGCYMFLTLKAITEVTIDDILSMF
jgi:hypothetical protein